MVLGAQIFNFVILVSVLYKFLYKPVLTVLEKRRERIELSLKQAADLDRKNKELEITVAQAIAAAKQESEKIVAESRVMGDKLKSEIVAQANAEAMRIIEKGELKIAREQSEMEGLIREKVATLALTITEKVLGTKLPEQVYEDQIQSSVSALHV